MARATEVIRPRVHLAPPLPAPRYRYDHMRDVPEAVICAFAMKGAR
jgi:hypothetical protein